MATLRRKTGSGKPVGLDIDGRYLAAVELEHGSLKRAASAELPPGAMSEGMVADAEALSEALKQFADANALPKSVVLGVSNQQIVVRQIELPSIGEGPERDAAVRFQAAEAIAMPLDESVLDYQVTGSANGLDGTPRMQVVVVAARRSMIEALVDAVKAAGLKPVGIDLDAFALVRLLAPPADSDDFTRVYCHLAGITTVAMTIGSTCLFTRPLTTAWDADDSAGALADEIRLSIDSYLAQVDAQPVAEVVLSGPGAGRDALADELSRLIGTPVSVAAPFGALGADGLPRGEDPHRHTVAAGLALGAAA